MLCLLFDADHTSSIQTSSHHREVSTAQFSAPTRTKSFHSRMNHSASDRPGSSRSKPKKKDAEQKARQRANKHYLKQAEKLNGGTESPPRPAIKWTRDVIDPGVIEGTLLSKAGRVGVLVDGRKKRIVLERAVIV